MSRQDQKVGPGALAVQGAGDVSVYLGATAEDFSRLMIEVGKQIATYHLEGQRKVEERLESFRREVLDEFAKGTRADPSALQDPDFQAALAEAQKGYVRSSDEDVSASLINLIAERSQEATRSRLSLTLNSAIEAVAMLTAQEIAVLTAMFHAVQSVLRSVQPEEVLSYLDRHLGTLAAELPKDSGSLQYLLTKGCVTTVAFSPGSFSDVIRQGYAHTFSEPFEVGALLAKTGLAADQVAPYLAVIRPGVHFGRMLGGNFGAPTLEGATVVRFNTLNSRMLQQRLTGAGVDADRVQKAVAFADERIWSPERVAQMLFDGARGLISFASAWTSSGMANYALTSLGTAIAYSNTKRLHADFNAPLSIWVQ